MRVVILSALLLMPCAARAVEIAGPYAISCSGHEVFDRMLRVEAAGDREAVIKIMERALDTGACKSVRPGQAVRIEDHATEYACVAKIGSPAACEWMLLKDLKP